MQLRERMTVMDGASGASGEANTGSSARGAAGGSNPIDLQYVHHLAMPPVVLIGISRNTCDFFSSEEGKIGQFSWREVPLSEYRTLPPQDVLETLKIHQDRKVFDYFAIASVEQIKDPLLLGHVIGSSDRWFIKQWGEDIALEDVL